MKDHQTSPRPKRISVTDRSETPENAIYVGPGSDWENRFHGQNKTAVMDREMFRQLIWGNRQFFTRVSARAELAGFDLACTCAPGSPCHADVLLEIANGRE
ncbi:DUF4326 domain-containing protein [Celeribacter sp.]|uniref:DUF4326 domain-containing protein n=1 Tax=Celeribacter sp. TaxID=1890673 RepID=UPI003A8ECDD1